MNVHQKVQMNSTHIINIHDELREKIIHLADEANQGESLRGIDYVLLTIVGLLIPAAILIIGWML